MLDPGELAALGVQRILGIGDSRHEYVELVAGIERGEEWLFQLDRADSIVVAAAYTDAVTIHRLTEFTQPLTAALLVQIQIGPYAIFRAILAMLLGVIAGAALHAGAVPVRRQCQIESRTRKSPGNEAEGQCAVDI